MNYDAIFAMLKEIIELCPDKLWNVRTDEPPFWQQIYHTLSGIVFYMGDSPESLRKPSFDKDKASDLKRITSEVPSLMQIQDYLEKVETNGAEISPQTISNITDKIFPLVEEWRSRALKEIYAILYVDVNDSRFALMGR